MRTITRKSLLYKTGVEYGDYTINHIEGCAHGCRYPCYAMQMSKRFGRIKTYKDWLKPKLVANAIELLKKELPRLQSRIKSVHLCFMSDPFMYGFPEVADLSLRIIKLLNSYGIKVTTLTKGKYAGQLLKYGYKPENEYGITLVSCNSSFLSRFEPNAYKWHLRIKQLERIWENGAKTWVSMEPYPTPNMCQQSLSELLQRVAFTDKIIFGKLNYNTVSSKFTDYESYYNDCVHEVIEFCNSNNITYHIKNGTYTYPTICYLKMPNNKSNQRAFILR